MATVPAGPLALGYRIATSKFLFSHLHHALSRDVQTIPCHYVLPDSTPVTSTILRQPLPLTEALAPGLGFSLPQELLASWRHKSSQRSGVAS